MDTTGSASHTPELHEFRDPAANLHAFVAIADERLGPTIGGCRFLPYPNPQEAIADARRLATAMAQKNSLAGLAFGGGKAVLVRPDTPFDRTALFEAFGAALNSLAGRYITAMDAGTETTDMDAISKHTNFVSGRTNAEGSPAPFTAQGLLHGIEAALAFLDRPLAKACVAIQGTGHVGGALAQLLADAGAQLLLADPVSARVDAISAATGGQVLTPEELPQAACDVFAPCGLGGILNTDLLPTLRCRIVAGGANNQLADPTIADALDQRGVLYVPDFMINAGGIIHAALAWSGTPPNEIATRIDAIATTVTEVLKSAQNRGLLPVQVAAELAEARMNAAS